ncbi:MAG: PQQ-dependent sugar dehydrogenase [Wenzhouxiangella sp.]
MFNSPALPALAALTFSIALNLLPNNAQAHWFFASGPSGCSDLSAIEPVANLDFNSDIQPLLQTCTGCHGQNGSAGLDLRPGEAYANLVGVVSNSNFDRLRVEPFNPEASSLFLGVNCDQPGGPGFQMPGTTPEGRALIRDWINQGAFETPFVPSVPDDVSLENRFPPGTFGSTSTGNIALGLVNAGDGSDRLFVVRQGGTIQAISPGGTISAFMNLTSPLSSGGERGLLSLAFHPDFADNGRFFVNYTAGSGHPSGAAVGDTVIAEYAINPQTGLGNPASERVLMTIAQDFSNHNGGQIKFGPDGYLYIGMGDGGSGNDPCNRSQTLDPDNRQIGGNCKGDLSVALLGKMLRIDVDNTTPAGSTGLCAANGDGSAEYAIPADNPFIGEDACAEVWSWGLRNPWRFTFDRETGDQWIADVGQNRWEEVNLERADNPGGDNYGWKVCEGNFLRGSTTAPCNLEGSILPVLDYATGSNCSITGGYRYRGPVESLQGAYVYGDYCTGRIWFAWQTGPNDFTEVEFSVEGFDLRTFGEDEDGHLYLVRNGGIWRFDGDLPPREDFLFQDRFEPLK